MMEPGSKFNITGVLGVNSLYLCVQKKSKSDTRFPYHIWEHPAKKNS